MESEQALDECGCAPSARERRLLWPAMSRRGALGFGVLGLATIGALAGPLISPAFAADYPVVGRRRAREGQRGGQGRPRSPRSRRSSRASPTRSPPSGRSPSRPPTSSTSRSRRTSTPPTAPISCSCRRTSRRATALDAANKAGRVAAQLYRNGGDDTSLELFFSGSAAIGRRPARAPRHDGQAHRAQPRRLRRGDHGARLPRRASATRRSSPAPSATGCSRRPRPR